MEKNIYKDEIVNILEVILEQTETIISYSEGQIPQIELDIVLENIRKLYNNFTILNKVNASLIDQLTKEIAKEVQKTRVKETPTQQPEKTIEKPVIEIEPEPVAKQIENIPPQPVKEIEKEPIVESKIETPTVIETTPELLKPILPEPIVEKEVVAEVPKKETIVEPKITAPEKPVKSSKSTSKEVASNFGTLFGNEAPSIADKYKDNKQSLHDTIGVSKEDISIGQKLQQKPITDLIKSIGINDKFLFIKELFANNGEEYSEAIQLLNNFSMISQAFDYLDILKNKYGWDEASDASLKLYDLIRRKYQN
jgi:hypothetical protein